MPRTAFDIAKDAQSDERLRETFEKFGCLASGGSYKEYEESKGRGRDYATKGKGKGREASRHRGQGETKGKGKEASRHMQLKKFQKN